MVGSVVEFHILRSTKLVRDIQYNQSKVISTSSFVALVRQC
jgi:hypothetical protein